MTPVLWVASVFFFIFVFLNLTLGVVTFYKLRVVLPGLRAHGTREEPRALVRGICRGMPGSNLRAPLSGRSCLAWRLQIVSRGGLQGLAGHSIFSGGSFAMEGGATTTRVELRGYESRLTDSTTFFGPSPWVLTADPKTPSFRAYIAHETLLSPTVVDLGRSEFDEVQRRALELLKKYRYERCEVVTHELQELTIDEGESWICEGPRAPGEGPPTIRSREGSKTVDGTCIKMAPADRWPQTRRAVILREATLLLFFHIVLFTIILLTWAVS